MPWLKAATSGRGSWLVLKNKRPAICRPFPSLVRWGIVGLLLDLKLPFDHVVLWFLLRRVRTGAGGGAGVDVVRGTGGCAGAFFVEHLAESVRRGFELLDGALDGLRVGPFGLLARRLDRLRQRAPVSVG